MWKLKNYNKADKSLMYYHIRRLAISMLAAVFVVYAFLILSKAWFNISKSINATGKSVDIIGSEFIDYKLYKWDYSANDWYEDPVDIIDITDAVPNQKVKYKVQTVSNYSIISSVIINFNIFTLPDKTQSDDLYRFIYISHDNVSKDSLSGIASNDYSYEIDSINSNECEFEIYISKDVCNYYSEWGMTGSLSVS